MIHLLLLFAALTTPPDQTQRTLIIERFDATITVNLDGTLEVTEAITARFTGSWNGMFRTIPVQYRTPQGFNWTLRLDLVSVTDDAGQSLRSEASRERHYIKYKVWVPGAENATRTIVLRYRVKNGLRFFEEHDELYWNVTGDEWEVPIESASARIELPAGAQGVRAIAFNGAYGSTAQDADVVIEGTAIRVAMPHRLEFHEGLTAVVGWNKGLVAEPTDTERAIGFLGTNWPLAIPIPVFFAMFAIWRRRGRDPKRRPVPVQYEPPDDLTPAEAGTLIDNSADMRDVTATVVDLAVRGYLRIEEREVTKVFGLIKSDEFVFHLLKQRSEWNELAAHEREVLSGIFTGRGTTVELSELENEFYKALPDVQKGVFAALLSRGFYRARPDTVRTGWMVGGVILGVIIVVAGSILGQQIGLTSVPFVIAGILVLLIVMGFGFFMPARTVPGARALEQVLGFEEFLQRVESERYQHVDMTPEMFERFLPFAMAFRVEKQWAKAFEGIYREPPSWYAGSNLTDFNAGNFSNRLGVLSSRAGATMASAPRSSGGSGFSGGSSGGGGGGGGGGGF